MKFHRLYLTKMINTKYKIDLYSYSDQGGYCTFYSILNNENLAFKEFISKSRAEYARKIQFKLSKYDLAPKVYSKLCKMKYNILFPGQRSGWGYITESAMPVKHNHRTMVEIQDLVDKIHNKTKLKFWDCHWYNVGLVLRDNDTKIVCIDTGKESFDGCANAWGLSNPGPKCEYCDSYSCECEE